MFERKSLKWPILLAIFMIVVLVGLTVGWILLNVFGATTSPTQTSSTVYWVLLSVGSIMFAFVLTGVILYLVWTIQNINLNRRQSNFIDSVTHELKTPIASLKLYLQTLNRRQVDEEQRATFYKTMMDDVERLDRLITQLLDVAKIQHKEQTPDPPQWVRIDEIARDCTEKLVAIHQVEASAVHINADACETLAHKIDIEVLLRNLIDNALKYSQKPPEVIVQIQCENNRIEISVEDNGHGIPRHLRRKIFSRFYRAGNELERKKPGTGLGLFLVRSIVLRLKGSVRVVDAKRKNGSRFVVSLPSGRIATSTQKNSPGQGAE